MGRRRRKTAGWHCTFQLCTFNLIIRFYSRQLCVQSGDEQAPQNSALTVSGERLGREHLRISSELVGQHDGFGNNLHGFALLANRKLDVPCLVIRFDHWRRGFRFPQGICVLGIPSQWERPTKVMPITVNRMR